MKPRHRGDLYQRVQRQVTRRVVMDVLNHTPQPCFVIDHTHLSNGDAPILHHLQETSLAELHSAIRLQKATVPAI